MKTTNDLYEDTLEAKNNYHDTEIETKTTKSTTSISQTTPSSHKDENH